MGPGVGQSLGGEEPLTLAIIGAVLSENKPIRKSIRFAEIYRLVRIFRVGQSLRLGGALSPLCFQDEYFEGPSELRTRPSPSRGTGDSPTASGLRLDAWIGTVPAQIRSVLPRNRRDVPAARRQ